MQSMLTDARWMFRFARTPEEQDDGVCISEYVKSGRYLITLRPTSSTKSLTEGGETDAPLYRAWVNDTRAFSPGDRFGEVEEEFTVLSVRDNLTGQSMEVMRL